MRFINPETIISARLGRLPKPRFRGAVLVFHSETRSRFAVDRFGGSPLGYKLLTGAGPEEVFLREDNQTVVVANLGAQGGGGPLAAALVEELAVLGTEVLIGIGCAGSVDRSLVRGTQFFARRALCTDGASRVYLGQGQADLSIAAEDVSVVERTAARLGIPIAATTGVTVDVLYRETPELVAEWQRIGGQWINMEVTPFYAAAAACGLRAVYLGHISDELFGAEWNGWFGEERNQMSEITA